MCCIKFIATQHAKLLRSVKPLPIRRFNGFQNGGRPPSWISFTCLDDSRRVFCGLCHCAKFCWNWCSMFDRPTMQVSIFSELCLKLPTGIHAPEMGFLGHLTHKWEAGSSQPQEAPSCAERRHMTYWSSNFRPATWYRLLQKPWTTRKNYSIWRPLFAHEISWKPICRFETIANLIFAGLSWKCLGSSEADRYTLVENLRYWCSSDNALRLSNSTKHAQETAQSRHLSNAMAYFQSPFYSVPQFSHCKRCTSYGNSVCLSVRHTPVLCQNDGT